MMKYIDRDGKETIEESGQTASAFVYQPAGKNSPESHDTSGDIPIRGLASGAILVPMSDRAICEKKQD